MGSLLEDAPVRTASVNYPELVVEWLPNQGPFAANGEWCDITDYVVSGSTQRGRQYELDQFQAGTCSITLQAMTRLFDPDNIASPFYPWLVPMRQIRVTAIWNGTWYPVFRGYITDWGQTTVQDKVFETTIQAKDAFALLEQIELPSSFWALTVPQYAPTSWFRLNETDTSRMSDSTTSGYIGRFENCQQGVPGLVVGDSDNAAAFAHSLEERIVIYPAPSLITGYPFSISMLFQVSGSDPNGYKVMFWGATQAAFSRPNYLRIVVVEPTTAQTGTVELLVSDGSATRRIVSNIRVDDNEIHHLLVVCNSASAWTIYIDGFDRTGLEMIAGSPAWPSTIDYYTIGNTPDYTVGDYGFGANYAGDLTRPERGTLDEIVIFNGVGLDSDAAYSLRNASLGWNNTDSGTRTKLLLQALNWPTALTNIANGIAMLQGSSWSAGASVLSVLQTWASSELGAFFVDPSGRIVWRSRHYPMLNSCSTTSQAAFGDAHSTESKYDDCELIRDEALIRNPVEASRRNGVSVAVSDKDYVEKYGSRRWSAPATEEQDDAVVRDRAEWVLARYKELKTRLAKLTISPPSDTTLWPKALGLDIGDRITVKRTPLGINSQIVMDQIIEGVSHTFSPRQWSTSYVGSPVDTNVNTFLILNDATYGALDSYRLAY